MSGNSARRKCRLLIIACAIFVCLLAATLLLSPLITPRQVISEVRVSLLVGKDRGYTNQRISTAAFRLPPNCVADHDGLEQPYSSVTVYLACLLPSNSDLPDRPIRLTLYGKEGPRAAPNTVPRDEAVAREELFERPMPDNPIDGYHGIIIAPDSHRNAPGVDYLSQGRFIALSDGAIVQLLRCILKWQVGANSDRVVGGSCYGFGRYKAVVFDTAFAVDRKMDERRISSLIRSAIDQMLSE